jgi:hypothetical protein
MPCIRKNIIRKTIYVPGIYFRPDNPHGAALDMSLARQQIQHTFIVGVRFRPGHPGNASCGTEGHTISLQFHTAEARSVSSVCGVAYLWEAVVKCFVQSCNV